MIREEYTKNELELYKRLVLVMLDDMTASDIKFLKQIYTLMLIHIEKGKGHDKQINAN